MISRNMAKHHKILKPIPGNFFLTTRLLGYITVASEPAAKSSYPLLFRPHSGLLPNNCLNGNNK
jgi:hypothetical protein